MTQTLRTKAELLALMPDNVSGDISPEDVRDFIVSNNVQQTQVDAAPAVLVAETDFFIADVGCTTLALTTVAAYGERTLSIANDSGGSLVVSADGAETIDGLPALVMPDGAYVFIGAENAGTNWRVILNTGVNPEFATGYVEDSGATTTINTVDVWEDLNAVLTEGISTSEFTFAGDEITYIGTATRAFGYEIQFTGMKAGGGTNVYEIALALNGTPISPFVGTTLNNSDNTSMHISGGVILSLNDVIKVQIRSLVGTNDVVMRDLNLVVTQI